MTFENNSGKRIVIAIDEKVCYNCKHRLWAVAIGGGVRCMKEVKNGWPPPIPGLRKSCDSFAMSVDIKRKLQLKKTNQLLEGSLSIRLQEYLWPEGKTFAEILGELTELQDAREDEVGAIMRIIQSQKGHASLTNEQELRWEVWNDLKKLVAEVRELKEWVEQC